MTKRAVFLCIILCILLSAATIAGYLVGHHDATTEQTRNNPQARVMTMVLKAVGRGGPSIMYHGDIDMAQQSSPIDLINGGVHVWSVPKRSVDLPGDLYLKV